jgi:small subunit ribosomal protein S5
MKTKINIQYVRPSGLELIEKVVSIQRVTKVTKGGRTFSFSAIVVVGDQNGVVGYGLGKGKEVTLAITKATDNAKKQLVRVPILNGTIPHEQYSKYGGASVFIRPASGGTGVIAGGAMRSIIEAVGIKDILAKSKGSTNPHNLVKATLEALMNLRDVNEIASIRGISINKVFNG